MCDLCCARITFDFCWMSFWRQFESLLFGQIEMLWEFTCGDFLWFHFRHFVSVCDVQQNHKKRTAFDNHTSNWKIWRIQLMVSGKIFNWTFTSNLNQTFSPNCPSSIEEPITFQLTIHNNHKIKELIKTYPNQIIKVFKFFT